LIRVSEGSSILILGSKSYDWEGFVSAMLLSSLHSGTIKKFLSSQNTSSFTKWKQKIWHM